MECRCRQSQLRVVKALHHAVQALVWLFCGCRANSERLPCPPEEGTYVSRQAVSSLWARHCCQPCLHCSPFAAMRAMPSAAICCSLGLLGSCMRHGRSSHVGLDGSSPHWSHVKHRRWFYCDHLGSQSCKVVLCAACELDEEQRPLVEDACSRRSSSECCSFSRHVELL